MSEPNGRSAVSPAEQWERVLTLLAALAAVKPLYAELDGHLLDLVAAGAMKYTNLAGERFALRDNFATTNTVFRPAGVKRWEAVPIVPAKASRRSA